MARNCPNATARLVSTAYRDELGLLPEAVINYLLRLGWGHGDEDIISRDQAVEWFDIADVNKGRRAVRS